jgi:hypothetical protein
MARLVDRRATIDAAAHRRTIAASVEEHLVDAIKFEQ